MTDVLPTIVGIALVACAAGFALLPLANRRQVPVAVPEDPATERSAIYRQVLELEFDYQVGKLSIDDYRLLSAQLLGQAGELMREERGSVGELDEEIEREIAAARAAFTAARESRPKRAARSSR